MKGFEHIRPLADNRVPDRPIRNFPLWETRDPPEETARRLKVARDALDRHQQSPKRPDAMICAEPSCERACIRCDMRCAIMTGAVWDLWRAHQRALSENDQTLQHDGRCYSVAAGSA